MKKGRQVFQEALLGMSASHDDVLVDESGEQFSN